MKCEDDKGLCENTPSRKTQMFLLHFKLNCPQCEKHYTTKSGLKLDSHNLRYGENTFIKSEHRYEKSRLESFQQWQMVE